MRVFTLIGTGVSLMAQLALSASCHKNSSGIPKPADFRKLENQYKTSILVTLGIDGCTNKTIRIRKSW